MQLSSYAEIVYPLFRKIRLSYALNQKKEFSKVSELKFCWIISPFYYFEYN